MRTSLGRAFSQHYLEKKIRENETGEKIALTIVKDHFLFVFKPVRQPGLCRRDKKQS